MQDPEYDAAKQVHASTLGSPKLRVRWVSFAFGAVILAALVTVCLHLSDTRQFARLLERAEPSWLMVAISCQAVTYLAQSAIWRSVTRAAGSPVSRSQAYRLSLAKLFVDQTLPSAGVSGTFVMARALIRSGVNESTVFAGVVVNMIAYHGAYLLCLGLALSFAAAAGHAPGWIALAWSIVLLAGAGLAMTALRLVGRGSGAAPAWSSRVSLVRPLLSILQRADRRLAHEPRLIARALSLHVTIVLLDSCTLFVLLRALGTSAPFHRVFASYMIANFLRSISFVPSGIGTFEAASVVTLRLLGVDVAAALSATLLFRLLSFWLPMLPGLWCARRALGVNPLRSRHEGPLARPSSEDAAPPHRDLAARR